MNEDERKAFIGIMLEIEDGCKKHLARLHHWQGDRREMLSGPLKVFCREVDAYTLSVHHARERIMNKYSDRVTETLMEHKEMDSEKKFLNHQQGKLLDALRGVVANLERINWRLSQKPEEVPNWEDTERVMDCLEVVRHQLERLERLHSEEK